MMTKKTDDAKYFVVQATANGNKGEIISVPMDKLGADALADNIKSAMEQVTGDFKMFKDVKVVAHKPDGANNPEYVSLDKKDSYNYSILDSLDKKIKG